MHINALELKASFLVLQTFRLDIKRKHIKVFCNNTTAMNYVNEMGGTESPICNGITTTIWDWCVANDAWITCSHILGKENTMADVVSCIVNDRHEWKLNVHIFCQLHGVFGTPVVDLFALRLNKQIASFCSWKPDLEVGHFDAFSLNWARFELSYILPQFH